MGVIPSELGFSSGVDLLETGRMINGGGLNLAEGIRINGYTGKLCGKKGILSVARGLVFC